MCNCVGLGVVFSVLFQQGLVCAFVGIVLNPQRATYGKLC